MSDDLEHTPFIYKKCKESWIVLVGKNTNLEHIETIWNFYLIKNKPENFNIPNFFELEKELEKTSNELYPVFKLFTDNNNNNNKDTALSIVFGDNKGITFERINKNFRILKYTENAVCLAAKNFQTILAPINENIKYMFITLF